MDTVSKALSSNESFVSLKCLNEHLTSLNVRWAFSALAVRWRFVLWCVFGWRIHHLPVLTVGCVKHTASVFSSSAGPQVRHAISDKRWEKQGNAIIQYSMEKEDPCNA